MKSPHRFLLSLWFLTSLGAWADATWKGTLTDKSDPALAKAHAAFEALGPALSRPAAGETIERPGFKLVLNQGTLSREAESFPGGPPGYLFSGQAEVTCVVQDPMERLHFKGVADVEEWKSLPVKDLYIMPLGASDPFQGPFSGPAAPGDVCRDLKHSLRFGGFGILMDAFNRSSRDPKDIMVLFEADGDLWCYRCDSENPEEMALLKLVRAGSVDLWVWTAVLSQHVNADGTLTSTNTAAEVSSKFRADMTRVSLDLNLSDKGDLENGTARLEMELMKPTRSLALYLNPLFKISAVRTGDGTPVPFLQTGFKEMSPIFEYQFILVLPEGAGRSLKLEVDYAGEMFEPNPRGGLQLRDEMFWFPTLFDADGEIIEIAATVPSRQEVLAIGTPGEKRNEVGRTTYTFKTEEKTTLATMVMGSFRHHTESCEGVELDVAFTDERSKFDRVSDEKSVRAIVCNCIKIYSHFLGPCPYKKITVSECSALHGMGFPSLLLLSMLFEQSMTAHETAHQWWGNRVRPLTYRDAWISEGLAELASYDYAMVMLGPHKLKEMLQQAEVMLRSEMGVIHVKEGKRGPILLGGRLNSSQYSKMVYNKAAWAMANLRKMALLAPPGGSLQPFYDVLRHFNQSSQGKMVSTQDLQRLFEYRYKMDLDWFFDQYFRKTEIPRATVQTTVKKRDGQFVLIVTGSQKKEFRLFIPIRITYGKKEKEVLFELNSKERTQQFPLDGEPSDVDVDPLNETVANIN